MRKCKICKKSEALYLMQYIASDTPSFYFPGEHVRGFSTTPVCEACADKQREANREANQDAAIPSAVQ
jgi:hypothetical protein